MVGLPLFFVYNKDSVKHLLKAKIREVRFGVRFI